MTPDRTVWQVLRKCWPLFGGAWSAWLVVRRLLEMHWNADSFGSAAYLMFGCFFALVFFIVGAAIAALLGRFVESLMRRVGAGIAVAIVVATLVNALAIWQIGDFVQSRVPALHETKVSGLFVARSPWCRDRQAAPGSALQRGAEPMVTCDLTAV